MKLKYDGEMINIGGELTWVPVDCDEYKGVLHLNETSADVLTLLKENSTEDKVVSGMQQQYNASKADIRWNVKTVIALLRSEGLLEE